VDGARTVIVGGINYYSSEKQGGKGIPVVSKYAYGKDYHIVLCEKLEILLEFITSCLPEASGKVFVDSAPIFEKAWAREAGLGWIGKNSILVNKEIGSFIFLGEIVLDIELQYDKPFIEDLCGSCRLCLNTCPTNAINENKTINASRCISWLTVENKKPIPEELKTRMENRIFGCDICQDVCPWNKNSKPNNNPDLMLSDRLKKMTEEDWLSLSREEFDIIFDKTSVKRTTYKRLNRNINFVLTGESNI
jgi:epoxyqueuosine reductase